MKAVTIYPPDHFVSVPGGRAVFSCVSDTKIQHVQWLVDGIPIEQHEVNITFEFQDIGHGVVTIHLARIPLEFNTTRIQCQLELESGRVEMSDQRSLILVKGKVEMVEINMPFVLDL